MLAEIAGGELVRIDRPRSVELDGENHPDGRPDRVVYPGPPGPPPSPTQVTVEVGLQRIQERLAATAKVFAAATDESETTDVDTAEEPSLEVRRAQAVHGLLTQTLQDVQAAHSTYRFPEAVDMLRYADRALAGIEAMYTKGSRARTALTTFQGQLADLYADLFGKSAEGAAKSDIAPATREQLDVLYRESLATYERAKAAFRGDAYKTAQVVAAAGSIEFSLRAAQLGRRPASPQAAPKPPSLTPSAGAVAPPRRVQSDVAPPASDAAPPGFRP